MPPVKDPATMSIRNASNASNFNMNLNSPKPGHGNSIGNSPTIIKSKAAGSRNLASHTSDMGIHNLLYPETADPMTTQDNAANAGSILTQVYATGTFNTDVHAANVKENSQVKSNEEIAIIQKRIAAHHKTELAKLLAEYLPPSVLAPHPDIPTSNTTTNATQPSILDLELRHALASLPLTIYRNHIISRPDRQAFEIAYRALEAEIADMVDDQLVDAMSESALAKVLEVASERAAKHHDRKKGRDEKRANKMLREMNEAGVAKMIGEGVGIGNVDGAVEDTQGS